MQSNRSYIGTFLLLYMAGERSIIGVQKEKSAKCSYIGLRRSSRRLHRVRAKERKMYLYAKKRAPAVGHFNVGAAAFYRIKVKK